MPTWPRIGPHTSFAVALGLALLVAPSVRAAPVATAADAKPATSPAPATTAAPAAAPAPAATSPAQPEPTPAPIAPAEIMAPSTAEPTGAAAPTSSLDREPIDPIDHEESEEDAERAALFFHSLYRPDDNPGRFNTVVRTSYTILGSNDHHLSGRFFGLSADIGQSWNTMGYALSLHANLGSLDLRDDGKVKAVALLGAGPTVNLGRLALLQRGFLDLRVGYDFYYAPARSIDPDIVATSLTPHGPRLQLHMGLMVNPKRQRRFFHGVGATVGYQALVGAFSGDLPFTSVLSFGLSHWMG